jgi:hypothetical protein
MAKIIIKKNSTPGSSPAVGDLDYGELAINYADGKLFYKKSDNTVRVLNDALPDQVLTLDNIASSFNSATTQFTISSSTTNFINSEIDTAARLIISVGGIIQQPDATQGAGFYISGGTDRTTDPVKINFVEAPKSGQTFFGIVLKQVRSEANVAYTTPELAIAYSIALG